MPKPKVEIELDHDGIRELLESGEMAAVLKSEAESRAARAGDGFEVTPARIVEGSSNAEYKGRQSVGIKSTTQEAAEEEANYKVLTRAVLG